MRSSEVLSELTGDSLGSSDDSQAQIPHFSLSQDTHWRPSATNFQSPPRESSRSSDDEKAILSPEKFARQEHGLKAKPHQGVKGEPAQVRRFLLELDDLQATQCETISEAVGSEIEEMLLDIKFLEGRGQSAPGQAIHRPAH